MEQATQANEVTSVSVASLFAESCARHGDRIALTLGNRSMTYAELNHAAGRVAAGLTQRGIGPGALVGICLERGFGMVAAMLGVVKAGAAYLPLDVRYPIHRLRETVADAGLALTIVEPNSELDGVIVHQLSGTWQADAAAGPDSRLYVIYTSGSTGKPKGVEVTHGNLTALLAGTSGLFHFTPDDVWTMFHSFAFDFSVWEMWGCLLTGGRLVIVPFELSRSPEDFHRLLAGERVTVLNQTPSAFALLDRADADADADAAAGGLALRLVIFGGEALAGSALAGWFARHGDSAPELVNMYGITETTVHVTYRRMRVADAGERESLMGEPIPGWTLDLLDDEIWVGGAGVARGYLNRPELTAERFVGGRYRSGDLARRRTDGELVSLGRRDQQVKINGFRIETGEVEAALRACAGVQQACVVARAGRLVAYVVGSGGAPGAELKRRLPAHMLPSVYVPLTALPLNANGKVDRATLPEPLARHGSPQAGSPMEQLVAGIWAQALGAEPGPDENFFDVGGTSLLLIGVRSALEKRLARPIPVTWMFECTTVKALSKRLEEGVVATPAHANAKANAARQRQAFAQARNLRSATPPRQLHPQERRQLHPQEKEQRDE